MSTLPSEDEVLRLKRAVQEAHRACLADRASLPKKYILKGAQLRLLNTERHIFRMASTSRKEPT